MGEMKGALLGLIFFVAFVIPAILFFGINGFNQQSFLKTTSEVSDMVKEDGGVSDRVVDYVRQLNDRGYVIHFKDGSGNPVVGLAEYGENLFIDYSYEFKGIFGMQELNTNNKVFLMQRNLAENTPVSMKTITLTSDELISSEQLKTFNIPNLKSIKSIVSNTGSVEIVGVNGNDLSVKLSGGGITRNVQTGGTFTPKTVVKDYKQVYSLTTPSKSKGWHEANNLTPTREYKSTNGFVGTLYFQDVDWTFVPQGVITTFKNAWVSNDKSRFDAILTSTANNNTVLASFKRINGEDKKDQWGDHWDHNPTIISSKYEGPILEDGPYYIGSTEYAYRGVATYTIALDGYTYKATYKGTVIKPEIDTRTYDNFYQYKLTIEYESH